MLLRLLQESFSTGWSQALLITGLATALALPFAARRPWLPAIAASAHLVLLAIGGLDAIWQVATVHSHDPSQRAVVIAEAIAQFMELGVANAFAWLPAALVGAAMALRALPASLRWPAASLAPAALATAALVTAVSPWLADPCGWDAWEVRVAAYGALAVASTVVRPPEHADTRLVWGVALAIGVAASEFATLSLGQIIPFHHYPMDPDLERAHRHEERAADSVLWALAALTIACASAPALREARTARRFAVPALSVLAALALATITRHAAVFYTLIGW